MSTPIVWVHGDCLSPHNPALVAHPGAPALFVWDDAVLDEWAISLKRIVFMTECLLELPVEIRRGDVAEELAAMARAHGTAQIVTSPSPAPRFRQIAQRLTAELGLELTVLEEDPFVVAERPLDLKRFSRYWRKVQKQALEPTADSNASST